MSEQGWNNKQTAPRLEKLELQGLIPMIIPDDVLDKIKYLCKKIAKVEWSGILFYTVEGTFSDATKMKITLRDIFLMDKGSAAYTSFDWDEDIVEYRMNNPESMDWIVGHIHSHNTMNVFFSGVDWSELNDNCPLHNFYLSVIVNNYLDIEAKIAFIAEPKTFICKKEDGKDFVLKLGKNSLDPFMFIYDCEPKFKSETIKVSNDFEGRLKQVEDIISKKLKEAEEKRKADEAKKKEIKNPVVAKDQQLNLYKKTKEIAQFPDWEKGSNHNSAHENSIAANLSLLEQFETEGEDDYTLQSMEQEFATYVLRLGNNEEKTDDELVDALEDIEECLDKQQLFTHSFVDSIIQTYGAMYDRFFEKIPKYHGDKPFLDMLEGVITEFEIIEKDYPFLVDIISALKLMGNKFELFIEENKTQRV